jgi:hypothetical protein
VKFSYNKKRYDLDPEQLSVAEGREIKKYAGMTLKEWQQGLEDIDPDAIAALVYTAVKRSGGEIEWHELDHMNLIDLANSIASENDLPDQDGVTPLHSENRQARRARATPRKPTAKK